MKQFAGRKHCRGNALNTLHVFLIQIGAQHGCYPQVDTSLLQDMDVFSITYSSASKTQLGPALKQDALQERTPVSRVCLPTHPGPFMGKKRMCCCLLWRLNCSLLNEKKPLPAPSKIMKSRSGFRSTHEMAPSFKEAVKVKLTGREREIWSIFLLSACEMVS